MNDDRLMAKNIKVRFAGETVILPTMESRVTMRSGVVIWIQPKPAGNWRPMATIPDGTLDKYKHCRPEILSHEWQ